MARFDATALKADNPLSEYLPKRGIEVRANGREWVCRCPLPGHGDSTPSFTIRQGRNGQQFYCFGCEGSGDVIGFVMQLDGVTFDQACEILGGVRAPPDNHRAPAAPAAPAVDLYTAWTLAAPPKGTPGIRAGERTPTLENPKRDKPARYTPTAVYRYNDAAGRFLAYVLRVEIDGKKLTPLIQWCENTETGVIGWCHRPFVGPRPLYRLHQLATRPDAQVLVVEGEKCADAAQALLPSLAVTTWQGGGKAAGKSDWSPVSGRDVLIWPDADPEGLTAAHEAGRLATEAGARSVRVIEIPADKPKGWDIADAIEDGWTKADVVRFARAGARPWVEPRETPQTAPEPPAADSQRFDGPADEQGGERERLTRPALRPARQEKPQPELEGKPEERRDNVVPMNERAKHWIDPEPSAYGEDGKHWASHLHYDGKGQLKRKDLDNHVAILYHYPTMRGVLTQDAMTGVIYIENRPPWDAGKRDWQRRVLEKTDATFAMMWLTNGVGEFKQTPTIQNTKLAIEAVAKLNSYDPAREYFERLEDDSVWDRIPRLSTWLTEYLNVEPTPGGIESLFGINWLVAAVARNLTNDPRGEKMDCALVLESDQGAGKSKTLECLATLGKYTMFTSSIVDMAAKDTVQLLQGTVISAFDEFTAVSKGDDAVVKGFMEKRTDKVRLPYKENPEEIRRRCVLAGTINPTGRGYLKDVTGGRRFWPVRVTGAVDMVALEEVKEQLWAEAVHLYRQGHKWWFEKDSDEEKLAEIEQAKRLLEDPWAEQLDDWLFDNPREITVRAAFAVLMISTDRVDPQKEKRVTDHFHVRGFVPHQKRLPNGRTKTVYVKRDQQ